MAVTVTNRYPVQSWARHDDERIVEVCEQLALLVKNDVPVG